MKNLVQLLGFFCSSELPSEVNVLKLYMQPVLGLCQS